MKLSDETYERIKRRIADVFEDYGIKEIPVDVFEIARKMKIKIVFASEILKKHPEKIDQYCLYKYPPSYMYYDSNTQKFIVYIDDVGAKIERQRFSLAHELMHIILGHNEQNPKNESEANFGATYILAPTSLALLRPGEQSLLVPEKIARLFGVSVSEAEIVARYNSRRLSLTGLKEKDYERKLNSLLEESLNVKLSEFH